MNEIKLEITTEEANVILEALGNMPFAKVYALVGKIQEQARMQLGGSGGQEDAPTDENPSPEIRD
uniref:Uncharacterized protein n=1 Tax=Candidatus Kentrum sp. SD TaxID=2126332 RepID=A0A450YCA5_9GAMM|nr:MAG: hypothetical protein BECKSD772F_GA0070984_100230 [Candidatus Kentron sp. SD]VFK39177.1 MAG: hypothetical protein BECKSD772E_GA0070983_100230 [Candidatus Kentron sp. SD]VFK77815.1 MAG: hypothetical protein BECKSD772D_GA0070982_100229 [Candidatus Kentron sp. SD]